jgi:flagellar assembly factor FliW
MSSSNSDVDSDENDNVAFEGVQPYLFEPEARPNITENTPNNPSSVGRLQDISW